MFLSLSFSHFLFLLPSCPPSFFFHLPFISPPPAKFPSCQDIVGWGWAWRVGTTNPQIAPGLHHSRKISYLSLPVTAHKILYVYNKSGTMIRAGMSHVTISVAGGPVHHN